MTLGTRFSLATGGLLCLVALGAFTRVRAQHAEHTASTPSTESVPTLPGQAAFGAIGEIVRMLKADPKTDWSKVNLEALRQHFVDMDEVVMHAVVAQKTVPAGLQMDVEGTGRTRDAIQRMLRNHAAMLDQLPEYHAQASVIPTGARLVVTARNPTSASNIAIIRGLGFAGLMTEGSHHAPHHLALARGEQVHQH